MVVLDVKSNAHITSMRDKKMPGFNMWVELRDGFSFKKSKIHFLMCRRPCLYIASRTYEKKKHKL